MRRIIPLFLFLLFLAGCNAEKQLAEKTLETQTRALADEYLADKQNKLILELSSSYQLFLLPDHTLLYISNGFWESLPRESKPFEQYTIARKYDGALWTSRFLSCSAAPLQIDKRNQDYPYKTTLSIEYKVLLNTFQGAEGIPVTAVLPYQWDRMRENDRNAYIINHYYAKLPEPEYDYYKIAHASGLFTEQMTAEKIPVQYSAKEKKWQLPVKSDHIKVKRAEWFETHTDAKAKEALRFKGFQEHNGKFFTEADNKTREYLAEGYRFVNGAWRDPQSIALAMALEKHPRRNYNFSDILNLLSEINANREAQDSAMACQLVQTQLQELIRRDSRNIKKLFQWWVVLSDPNRADWTLIDLAPMKKFLGSRLRNYFQEIYAQEEEKLKKLQEERQTQIRTASASRDNELTKLDAKDEAVKNSRDHALATIESKIPLYKVGDTVSVPSRRDGIVKGTLHFINPNNIVVGSTTISLVDLDRANFFPAFNEVARSEERSRIEMIYQRKLRNNESTRKEIEASYQALVSKLDTAVKDQQEKLDKIREQLAFFPDR